MGTRLLNRPFIQRHVDMVTLNNIQQKFPSTLGQRPAAASMSTLREFCDELLADLPPLQRTSMLERLDTLRRASDLWSVRTVLFEVIARHHDERVAQDRLRELDSKLMPFTVSRQQR